MTDRSRIARRAILWAAVAAAACARQGIPPGGPRDDVPPFVVSTFPDSGAVDVPLDAGLEIEFSEPMRRSSVIDWVLLSPPRDFAERSWKGRRFRLTEGDDYRPRTTYTVIVGTGSRDLREGNAMRAPHVFVFSTGDSIDPGRIEGRLLPKAQTAHGTIIWALDVEVAAARPDTVLPDYIAQAAADSSFVFLGLRVGVGYVVAAHHDANRDREFDRDLEFLAFYPDTLWLSVAAPALTGIDIDFRDPRAPGTIAGGVIDSTRVLAAARAAAADTAAAVAPGRAAAPADTVGESAAAQDTLPPLAVHAWPLVAADGVPALDSTAVRTAVADTAGAYELEDLEPGSWRLRAFVDRNRNQRYDAGEPASPPADSVRVVPLETTRLDLVIPPALPEAEAPTGP